MDLYDSVACQASRKLTLRYSTSFGTASRLFPSDIRLHIYNIYGLVRIADEIVDTFSIHGSTDQTRSMLDALENETYAALERRYSPNVIVHAFQLTCNRYGIGKQLIEPFFASMREDIVPHNYDRQAYEMYIYGSAEVIGLMCLKVFVSGDQSAYADLEYGAKRLGSAYQKVNFLRDLASDRNTLGRSYIPEIGDNVLDEKLKALVIEDIAKDFEDARAYIERLPQAVRPAVKVSYRYYLELLSRLEKTPASDINTRRIRLPNTRKVRIALSEIVRSSVSARLAK